MPTYATMRLRTLSRLPLFLLSVLGIQACDIALPGDNDDTRFRIEQLISNGKYEEASELLKNAADHAIKDDAFIMKINDVVLDIEAGQCPMAIRKLHAMQSPSQPVEEKRWIHYFSAFARLCETLPGHTPSHEEYHQALNELLIADSLGVPCRGYISQILRALHRPCDAFQVDIERAASVPQNAIPYHSGQKFTVCPDKSLWMKFDARALEQLTLSAVFTKLQRQYIEDESSQLPYAHPRIRLYASNKDNLPRQDPFMDAELASPSGLPKDEEFERRTLQLPEFIAKHGDPPYYIELSTRYNGEMAVELELKRDVDCSVLDDRYTWTNDLKPLVFKPEPVKLHNKMLLCPNRPDKIGLNLEPNQSLIMMTYARDDIRALTWSIQHADHPARAIHFKDVLDNPAFEFDPGNGIRVSALQLENLASRRTLGPLHTSVLVTIVNTKDVTTDVNIIIDQNTDHVIPYALKYMLSEDCKNARSDTSNVLNIELPVSLDNRQRPLATYQIGWICPYTKLEFHPIFTSKALTGHYLTALTMFTPTTHHLNDFTFESVLRTDDNANPTDFLVETGKRRNWSKIFSPYTQTLELNRPLTNNSILKLKSSSQPGFWVFMMIPREDRIDSNTDRQNIDNQESNKDQTQNQDMADKKEQYNNKTDKEEQYNKTDREETNNNDAQNEENNKEKNDANNKNDTSDSGDDSGNNSAQDPSDTESSKTRNGQGAPGNTSETPTGNNGRGARSYTQTPDEFEKSRYKEVLDTYENGFLIRPKQNIITREVQSDEKNW